MLPRKFTKDIANFLTRYHSIPFSEIGKRFVQRLTLSEKFKLMTLMLTLEEASVLTRIPKESFRKAAILSDIKMISLGGRDFVLRSELERILGVVLDEEKIFRICTAKALLRRRHDGGKIHSNR
jgi:hypothetical protein